MSTHAVSAARMRPSPSWLRAIRVYLAVLVPLMFVWEVAQLPLYTIWQTESRGEMVFAVLHCVAGDGLIGLAALGWSLIAVGKAEWPQARFWSVTASTLIIGLGYAVYSEWLNVDVRGSWAYTSAMPRLPPLGTGLAPVLQWIVLPLVAMAIVRRVIDRDRAE